MRAKRSNLEVDQLQALRLRLHRLEPSRPLRTARAAVTVVRERGIVMETGRASLPVLAEAIVGRHLRGSWMADREVYRIHRLLNRARKLGIVAAPLVLGKETLFASTLGPPVERIARDPARTAAARETLSLLARRLLEDVEHHAEVRMDRWSAPAPAARRARLLLLRLLLVWSRSIHTEAGYHTALVIPWAASTFSRRFAVRARRLTYDEAQRVLLLAAVRSAVVAPEAEVRRWFVFGGGPLDDLIVARNIRRIIRGRVTWLTAER